ncbi:PREDICTED: mammaglobin-B-like [Propithecus coquereli]|uniref:Secretoglobin family 2A member 1 n=1 Tax=Propithecus coquereli TaxID=379532 RepID=A0A2K6GZL1_PROCO|nr:PREDICTED: mammaglobin-B-like [Propithecus coquereli]
MKLLMVLLLVAFPLYCSAGSGCRRLEDIINKLLDKNMSVSEFKNDLREFIHHHYSSEAVGEFKQCFLNQSDETLKNIGSLMQIIYDSRWCRPF